MAHVHAQKTLAGNGAAKMMDAAMGKMTMGPMMGEGMGSMMKGGMGSMMGEGMHAMMKGEMAPMIKAPVVTGTVATGAAASAGSNAGKSVLKKVFTNPFVLFGLGVVAGYYLYKNRKTILTAQEAGQQEE